MGIIEITSLIRYFIKSNDTEISIPLISLGTLEEIITKEGFERIGYYERDANNVDFWLYYKNNDTKITASGSLWDNNRIWLLKSKIEE